MQGIERNAIVDDDGDRKEASSIMLAFKPEDGNAGGEDSETFGSVHIGNSQAC